MKFTAAQIAGILNGTVDGDEDVQVHTLAKIEEGEVGSLTFLANPKYTQYIYTTKSSITIVNHDFTPEHPIETTLIRRSEERRVGKECRSWLSAAHYKK